MNRENIIQTEIYKPQYVGVWLFQFTRIDKALFLRGPTALYRLKNMLKINLKLSLPRLSKIGQI